MADTRQARRPELHDARPRREGHGQGEVRRGLQADGMLFAKLLLSPMPHARVMRIDTSAALAMPGVKAILTADDCPAPRPGQTLGEGVVATAQGEQRLDERAALRRRADSRRRRRRRVHGGRSDREDRDRVRAAAVRRSIRSTACGRAVRTRGCRATCGCRRLRTGGARGGAPARQRRQAPRQRQRLRRRPQRAAAPAAAAASSGDCTGGTRRCAGRRNAAPAAAAAPRQQARPRRCGRRRRAVEAAGAARPLAAQARRRRRRAGRARPRRKGAAPRAAAVAAVRRRPSAGPADRRTEVDRRRTSPPPKKASCRSASTPTSGCSATSKRRFKQADLVLDETFVGSSTGHQPLETRTAMAYWQNGKLYLHGSTQSTVQTVAAVDARRRLDPASTPTRSCSSASTPAADSAARFRARSTWRFRRCSRRRRTRRCMMRITREEEHYIGRARPGLHSRVKVGFRKDGRIPAIDGFAIADNGPYNAQGDVGSAGSTISLCYQPTPCGGARSPC